MQAAEGAYLGRVASLTMIGIALNGVAALPTGLLADAWGERAALEVMGMASMAATLLLVIWRKRMSGSG
jgi:hypothetical protein